MTADKDQSNQHGDFGTKDGFLQLVVGVFSEKSRSQESFQSLVQKDIEDNDWNGGQDGGYGHVHHFQCSGVG